jgi:3-phosphoshikimate 1-carboxyvinyltransferase
MAMSMTVAGLVATGETTVDNLDCMNVSFPGFLEVLASVAVS